MLSDVRELLERAGFPTQATGRGVTVESAPEGVRVVWQPELALLGPIRGVKAAMNIAMTAVLERAGYQVRTVGTDLLVVGSSEPPAFALLHSKCRMNG